ncbi:hypothetical protein BRYFOR_05134 [Marvinbryantia formatexigens DSM 14469]|uniref:Uncharacterized protein n=1 Tax=Marvinbryantia formatexigens DSM 14469 TaxID=478749 RepID=C6L944_9FIRM|nr:hypothetical protein BRYFOR_05134 [Marvinbryantia formatexigens DSM 14469]
MFLETFDKKLLQKQSFSNTISMKKVVIKMFVGGVYDGNFEYY